MTFTKCKYSTGKINPNQLKEIQAAEVIQFQRKVEAPTLVEMSENQSLTERTGFPGRLASLASPPLASTIQNSGNSYRYPHLVEKRQPRFINPFILLVLQVCFLKQIGKRLHPRVSLCTEDYNLRRGFPREGQLHKAS